VTDVEKEEIIRTEKKGHSRSSEAMDFLRHGGESPAKRKGRRGRKTALFKQYRQRPTKEKRIGHYAW